MQFIGRAVGSFLDELTTLIEPKRKAGRRLEYTLVERGDEFECYQSRRRGPSLVAKGSLDRLNKARLPRRMRDRPVELRLDGSRVLTKIMQFPSASRGYLDAIVRHQLDRATPWAADRVVFDYVVAEDEPAAEGQMAVRLVATSRDVFERSMNRLAGARIKAGVVGTSEDPIDRPSAVNLLHADHAERRAALRRKVGAVLVGFIVVVAGLSALTGWQLYTLRAEAAGLEADVDTLRARIEAARAGDEKGADRERLIASKRESLPMVVLLDKLSATIPSNTYLRELSVENGEVKIAGLTSDAPALIGILEESDMLSSVRFAAPTLRDEGETRDRFEIAAAIALAGTPTD